MPLTDTGALEACAVKVLKVLAVSSPDLKRADLLELLENLSTSLQADGAALSEGEETLAACGAAQVWEAQAPPEDAIALDLPESGSRLTFTLKSDASAPTEAQQDLLVAAAEGLAAHFQRLRCSESAARLPDQLSIGVIDGLDIGVQIFDCENRLIASNCHFSKIFPSLASVSTPGARLIDIFDQVSSLGSAGSLLSAGRLDGLRSKAGQSMEMPLSDGRVLMVCWRRAVSGELVVTFSDVSEAKRAEQTLVNAIESAQICTWEWNIADGSMMVNDRWAAILGYRLSDVSPVSYEFWRSRVHPDDLPRVEPMVLEIEGQSSDLKEVEYRLLHREGHWVWVLDRSRILERDHDGNALLMAGIQFSIHDRKQKEEALVIANAKLEAALSAHQQAEQRFYDISRVSQDWFWEQDAELRFTYRTHGQWFGADQLPEGNFIGRTRRDWLVENPEAAVSADWDALLKLQEERQPFRGFIFSAPSVDGDRDRWYRISGTPTYDAQGNFTGYRGVGTDVSELYREKARAEEASKSKSDFLADMSHEIRTPLNGVMGMAELLERTLATEDQKRMVAVMRRSCETLLSILNGILDMSKIEAGKLEIEDVVFDPVAVARRVRDVHEPTANEKGIDFDLMIGSGAMGLRRGDPLRVQQILHNLISNALKFTENGEVMVRVGGKAGKPLTVEVRDTGIGMTPEQVQRVFRSFTQADSSVARRFGGSGLGLSITSKLVDLMGGEISIDSTPGEGTTVRLVLPLAEAEEVNTAADLLAETVSQPANLTGLNLLVADDNPTNCMVMRLMLEGAGAVVTTANDGLQAVNAWAPRKYDAVLLDIAMPVMDGMRALAEIRTLEENAGLPPGVIIAVTANAMPHQVTEYIIAGFDTCVSKPVDSITLTNAITSLVGSAAR